MQKRIKIGKKWNNKSSETIFWAMPHPGLLVLLVVDSNHFFSLVHSKIREQYRLHLWGQSEDFSTSAISGWVFTIPFKLVPASLLSYSSFICPLYITCCLNGPCTSHKIFLPYCAWDCSISGSYPTSVTTTWYTAFPSTIRKENFMGCTWAI